MSPKEIAGTYRAFVDGNLVDENAVVEGETQKAILMTIDSEAGYATGWWPKSRINIIRSHLRQEVHVPRWIFDRNRQL